MGAHGDAEDAALPPSRRKNRDLRDPVEASGGVRIRDGPRAPGRTAHQVDSLARHTGHRSRLGSASPSARAIRQRGSRDFLGRRTVAGGRHQPGDRSTHCLFGGDSGAQELDLDGESIRRRSTPAVPAGAGERCHLSVGPGGREVAVRTAPANGRHRTNVGRVGLLRAQ